MQEGRDDRIADVIVLAVRAEARGGAEGGIGGGGAGVAKRACGADDGHRRGGAKAQ